MKILMVTMSLDIGGAETHIVELCKSLSALGHNITIASNGGSYEESLKDTNITLIHFPLNKRKICSILKSYTGLKKLIQENKYDIVHAHARIPAFICGLVKRSIDFRFTTTAHLDFKITPLLKTMSNWGEKTIAVSSDIKDYLIKNYNIDESNISLTINGIDTNNFKKTLPSEKIINELNLQQDTIKITSISRLDTDRSLAALTLIDITKDLCKEKNIEILIVGDGNDFDKIKEKSTIVNKNLGKSIIHLLGARTDINDILSVSDIIVGVSRSALEAMSSQKPVILAGNQGYLGIFNDDVLSCAIDTNFCCRGYFATTKELLLKDCLSLLNKEPSEIEKIGIANRQIIEKYYSNQKMTSDYLNFYDSLTPYNDFKYPDIIISGYYGHNNQGDDTLLKVIYSEILKSNKNLKISVLAKNPKDNFKKTGINSINRFSLIDIWKATKHSKLLISGGGTLFQDATSKKSLFYYLLVIKIAKLNKNKVYIFANGIGPLKAKSSKEKVLKVLNTIDKITVRTPKDKEYLLSIGATNNIDITADPAYLIDASNLESTKISNVLESKNYYAVSIRKCVTKNFDEKAFEDNLAKALIQINKTHNIEPVFIPMQSQYDELISQRMIEKIGCGIIAKNLDADQTSYLFSKMKFVIGMRLHALIFASNVSTPIIGISYDPKVDDLLDYIGIDAIKIDNKLDENIISSVENIFASYDKTKQLLKAKSNMFKELSKKDIAFVNELL